MNREEALDSAKKWCDAWNRRDIDSVIEHYADNVRFGSPTIITRLGIKNGWIEGKQKLREHFTTGMKKEGLHFELVEVLMGVSSVVVVYRRENGSFVADVNEFDSDGKIVVAQAFYGKPNMRK